MWIKLAIATALLAGCSSTAPVADGPPLGTFAATACAQCIATACPSETNACASDPSCNKYLTCRNRCPALDGRIGPGCDEACAMGVDGVDPPTLDALGACEVRANCPMCGPLLPPILSQSCSPSDSMDGCARCEATHCCETYGPCAGNAQCEKAAACVLACDGPGTSVVDGDRCKADCLEAAGPQATALARRVVCEDVYCTGLEPCGYKAGSGGLDEALAKVCEGAFANCHQDPECWRVDLCERDCAVNDAACVAACERGAPAIIALARDLRACELASHLVP